MTESPAADPGSSEFPRTIGKVARRELARNGFTRWDQLTTVAARELLALHGIGPKAVQILSEELDRRGSGFREADRVVRTQRASLSPRLSAIVAALPLEPHLRVLEIGCGPGAAARAVAARLTTGHILATDRSISAVAQARRASAAEIESGRMSVRQMAAEELSLSPGEGPYDLVFAIRVGALDGRHPEAGRVALRRIAAVTTPAARLFVDGGNPLRELIIDRSA